MRRTATSGEQSPASSPRRAASDRASTRDQGRQPVGRLVAMGEASGPYIDILPPRACSDRVDARTVAWMLITERASCFGGSSLQLEGSVRCAYRGGGQRYVRAVLAGDRPPRPIPVAFGPQPADTLLPARRCRRPRSRADCQRVVGHFDDPRASTCTVQQEDENGKVTAFTTDMALLLCRQRFVVDEIELLEPDPSYQPTSQELGHIGPCSEPLRRGGGRDLGG